jgi:hypothetical protein
VTPDSINTHLGIRVGIHTWFQGGGGANHMIYTQVLHTLAKVKAI